MARGKQRGTLCNAPLLIGVSGSQPQVADPGTCSHPGQFSVNGLNVVINDCQFPGACPDFFFE